MKQLLVLSGKGGTGKTTVAAAFIKLSAAGVFADCDVDAPNLHLVIQQEMEPQKKLFYSLPKAHIDTELCTGCGLCFQKCRFDAISQEGGSYRVDLFACEGCAVCGTVCPKGAISYEEAPSGDLLLYQSPKNVFSTARLKMGSGASGKLVSEVKNQIKEAAVLSDLVIVDGSPGIGCPVIASLSGADMVLLVAEPSLSGISDLERIIKTADHFGTKILVCINKYDTHTENAKKIEAYCLEKSILFAGKIPYDPEAVRAVNCGETVIDRNCPSGSAVRSIFDFVIQTLFYDERGG